MRRRTRELTGEVPMGADPRIPYDRTDPMQQVATPPGPAPGGAPPDMPPGAPDLGAGGPAVPPDQGAGMVGGAPGGPGGLPDQGGLGGGAPPDQGGQGTDALTGADLASLAQPDQLTPQDLEIQQMEAALNDPNTDPQTKQQIQQIMALVARKKFVEMSGQGMMQQQGPGLGGGLAG